jgi:hypothetical protein
MLTSIALSIFKTLESIPDSPPIKTKNLVALDKSSR